MKFRDSALHHCTAPRAPADACGPFVFKTPFFDVNQTRRALLALPAALAASATFAQNTPEPIRLALIEGLSGPFANAGEAVFRNLLWATERINQRGGVRLGSSKRLLALQRFDSKGNTEEAVSLLRSALDQGFRFVLQGNSSATAAALIDAVDKHNQREPAKRALFLNYSAVDPVLSNERCSPWHFRFDAHADMRLAALTDVLRDERGVQRVYLIGQDYSFGQHVLRQARVLINRKRPDMQIVGDELHPLGRVKDFVPYASKIVASGAQAVLTPNWGNDLALLVRALREVGSEARLYTFYGNALGTPSAIGEAGVGRVLAVAEWHPNLGGAASDALYAAFRQRFAQPQDDYVHLRMQLMLEMLAVAIERAGGLEAVAVSRALEGLGSDSTPFGSWHPARMRAADHQLQQPLVVSVMERAGAPGVAHDVEGSGFGFRTLRRFEAADVTQPHSCKMTRPD
jgi:branched-chain amino acid transport system substrate-binding protein